MEDKINSIKNVVKHFIDDEDVVWSNSYIVKYDGETVIEVSCMDKNGYGRSRVFGFGVMSTSDIKTVHLRSTIGQIWRTEYDCFAKRNEIYDLNLPTREGR